MATNEGIENDTPANDDNENGDNNESTIVQTPIGDLYEHKIEDYLKSENELLYSKIIEDIKDQLKDPDLCIGINHLPQLEKGTFVMMLHGKELKDSEPILLGFASIHFYVNSLVLDLLCGNRRYKGVGTALIEAIKTYAYEHGYNEIRLNSVPSAYGFYYKLNFIPDGKIIPMHLPIRLTSNSNSNSNSSGSNSGSGSNNNSNNGSGSSGSSNSSNNSSNKSNKSNKSTNKHKGGSRRSRRSRKGNRRRLTIRYKRN